MPTQEEMLTVDPNTFSFERQIEELRTEHPEGQRIDLEEGKEQSNWFELTVTENTIEVEEGFWKEYKWMSSMHREQLITGLYYKSTSESSNGVGAAGTYITSEKIKLNPYWKYTYDINFD